MKEGGGDVAKMLGLGGEPRDTRIQDANARHGLRDSTRLPRKRV